MLLEIILREFQIHPYTHNILDGRENVSFFRYLFAIHTSFQQFLFVFFLSHFAPGGLKKFILPKLYIYLHIDNKWWAAPRIRTCILFSVIDLFCNGASE